MHASTAPLTLSAVLMVTGLGGCRPAIGPRELSPAAQEMLTEDPDEDASRDVAATFEAELSPEARRLYQHDPALDCVARVAAQRFSDSDQERVPPDSLIRWLFWRCRATSQPAGFWVAAAVGQGYGKGDYLDGAAVRWARRVKPRGPRRYGVSRFREGQYLWQAIVFGAQPLEVLPIPVTYMPGQTLTLRARPQDASTDYMFFMSLPQDRVTQQAISPGADGWLSINIKVPDVKGRYFIEITAREPALGATDPEAPWRKSLLWQPIYVGVAEPSVPDDFITHPTPNPPDPATWAHFILQQYNAERARLGRRPAVLRDEMSRLAQQQSDEAARAEEEPPPEKLLIPKLRAAGVYARDYFQSLGAFEFVPEHVTMRLLRPSVRAKLFSSDELYVGLGISRRIINRAGLTGATDTHYAVVEYLAVPITQPAPPIPYIR